MRTKVINIFSPKGGHLKPIKRSKLRLYIGKTYYTWRRTLKWCFLDNNYAKQLSSVSYKHEWIRHSSPLYRSLKNVDLWLQENKIHNLKIATKRINGIIIQPGETFSYWKLIGNPSKSKGYKPGMILYCGTFKSGTGGGLCQLSNLLFWMALHTPLTIVERYRHSYDVFPDVKRKLPFGSGATCVYNYRDLQLKNETSQPLQIIVTLTDTHLTGKIVQPQAINYSYEVYESHHQIHHHYWGGYTRHNTLSRKIFKDGELLDDKFLFENHALMMYQPFLAESE